MTIAETSAAWAMQIPPKDKLVLLAAIECCGQLPANISGIEVACVAAFTGYSVPQIQSSLAALVKRGMFEE